MASASTSPTLHPPHPRIDAPPIATPENCPTIATAPEPNSPELIRCRHSRCARAARRDSPEAVSYKNCHNCDYAYCSRACRRAHWEKHRKTCLFSRVGALCRQVIASARAQARTLEALSAVARRGHLTQGSGAVKIFFPCPESAEKFLRNGLASEPTYVPWPDFLPSEMGPQLYAELVAMCKKYNAATKLVLYVSVCVVSEAPAAGAVKWERQLVSRCGKLRLSAEPPSTTDTLVLIFAVSEEARVREIGFGNAQRALRARGVSLRRQFPEVHRQLASYADSSECFRSVTIYPKDGATGKAFACMMIAEDEAQSVRRAIGSRGSVRTINLLQNDVDLGAT